MFFFLQAEDGIRDIGVTGVQTCALPISAGFHHRSRCTTWLAAVSVSPVPPARSDSSRTPGPGVAWKRATRASRSARRVPPERKSGGYGNRVEHGGGRII